MVEVKASATPARLVGLCPPCRVVLYPMLWRRPPSGIGVLVILLII
jgi:hypothetical protein